MSASDDRWGSIVALRRAQERNLPARWIGISLLFLTLYSWLSGHLRFSDLFSARRTENFKRFITQDALPEPLRSPDSSASDLFPWVLHLLRDHGLEALLTTFWISLAAMSLAALSAFSLGPIGCRPLFSSDPYIDDPPHTSGSSWIPRIARTLWVIIRAVPEYVWAFFLLAALGPSAWPAILALALHNAAILARLSADTLEDAEPSALRSLRARGASRRGLLVHGLWPLTSNRFLLYAFYRFETCVREATVLGMLGIASLGYWVIEARAHQRHDEMIVLILLGAFLVLAIDLSSVLVRRAIRRG